MVGYMPLYQKKNFKQNNNLFQVNESTSLKKKKKLNIFEISHNNISKNPMSQNRDVLSDYIDQNTSQFFLLETHNYFEGKKFLKKIEITIQKGYDNMKSTPEEDDIWNEITLL